MFLEADQLIVTLQIEYPLKLLAIRLANRLEAHLKFPLLLFPDQLKSLEHIAPLAFILHILQHFQSPLQSCLLHVRLTLSILPIVVVIVSDFNFR